jgi:hypothetical protein
LKEGVDECCVGEIRRDPDDSLTAVRFIGSELGWVGLSAEADERNRRDEDDWGGIWLAVGG